MNDRDQLFQHLVLNGIWLILLAITGRKSHYRASQWRDGAVRFGDDYGEQGDDAKRVRREITYWMPKEF